jgi:hypothetical protein
MYKWNLRQSLTLPSYTFWITYFQLFCRLILSSLLDFVLWISITYFPLIHSNNSNYVQELFHANSFILLPYWKRTWVIQYIVKRQWDKAVYCKEHRVNKKTKHLWSFLKDGAESTYSIYVCNDKRKWK